MTRIKLFERSDEVLSLEIHYTFSLTLNRLRGCPCKNLTLDFRPKTEFLQIFCARQEVHMINKNSNNLAFKAYCS